MPPSHILNNERASTTAAPGYHLFLIFILANVTIVYSYCMLATNFSGSFFVAESLNGAYDELGDSLLKGETTVKREFLRNEVRIYNNKPHMYFGPLPAFFRIIANTLYPEGRGKWGRISSLLAAILAICGATMILKQQSPWAAKSNPGEMRLWDALILLCFAFGTPLLFLISWTGIYHEAMLWGLASSIWGIHYIFTPLSNYRNFGLSVSAGAALLSRVTFGIPLYMILLVELIREIFTYFNSELKSPKSLVRKREVCLRVTSLLMPALLFAFFQMWYNYDRFNSVIAFNRPVPIYSNSKNPPMFMLERIPHTLSAYFGINSQNLSTKLPFVKMLVAKGSANSLFPKNYREFVVSLLLVSPVLFPAALRGILVLVRSRNWHLLICTICLAVQPFILLSYFFISMRFTADFLPLLLFLAICGLTLSKPLSKLFKVTSVLLGTISVIAMPMATISWQSKYWWTYPAEHTFWIRNILDNINRALGFA